MTCNAIEAGAPARRKLEVRLHGGHVGIWQDNANDPTFRTEVFERILKMLARYGWKVTADPTVSRRYRRISPSYRLASRGDVRAAIHISGCMVEVKFWSEAAPCENRNGPRYGFDHRKRAPYLDRIRFDLATNRIIALLRAEADVTVVRRDPARVGRGPGCISAAEYLVRHYAECWHTVPVLGRPAYSSTPCDRKSADGDGSLIEHGARVWYRDRKGRIGTGIAHYRGGQGWIIVVGAYALAYAGSHEIYTRAPPDLRRKRNARDRRKRLEAELALAIRAMRFGRAETLRRILFGSALTYGIWAKDKEAFYRSDYAGYTTDSIEAGRYTWDEAVREVRRVPHELRLVLPDGTRLAAHEIGRARAA